GCEGADRLLVGARAARGGEEEARRDEPPHAGARPSARSDRRMGGPRRRCRSSSVPSVQDRVTFWRPRSDVLAGTHRTNAISVAGTRMKRVRFRKRVIAGSSPYNGDVGQSALSWRSP